MLKFIDSHAHLTSSAEIFAQVDEILKRALEAGVERIVNICTDVPSLERGIELKKRYPFIYNTASTTPHDVDAEGAESFPVIAEAVRSGNLQAIGETGLDYFYAHSDRENQKFYLKKYLKLALEYQKPVVIHCREAFQDFFKIIDEEYTLNGRQTSGILHCFTGTLEEAKEVIARDWYLSLSGIVTFKKSLELHNVAKYVPLEKLLIETDAPYLAPQSKRGKQNEPAYVTETAKFIADIKGVSIETLAQITYQNSLNAFQIKI